MNIILEINSILIFSEENKKYFYTTFKDKLNVIYGKNTAGKSTLIQLLLFAFGINDNKIKLTEILADEIFVRLDCTIKKGESKEIYVFIRQDETLLIKDYNNKIIRFNGIGSDSSAEHIKLKKYFSELFNFNLVLESKNGITNAPIETIFLPYYISQEVGWVYLRNSFSNLNFYKNFKEDFLDYYLNIESGLDREKKAEIEKKISILQEQIRFYSDVKNENQDLKLANIISETISGKANQLIEDISNRKNKLLELENDYVKNSNTLTFYNQRLAVLSIVKRNHKNQEPGKDNCPTCTQVLPSTVEVIYEFLQEENDTSSIQSQLKEKVKKLQSTINSLNKKIEVNREEIEKCYNLLNKYSENEISIESLIDNKANIQLFDNLIKQIGQLNIDLKQEKENLKDFKTDDEILIERGKKSKIFKDKYLSNNATLGLPPLENEIYYNLYDISSFPYQGTQLHLAVLSYHFAFNSLLTKSNEIHRLPFILDCVFKEDVDGGNKDRILKFINSNFPKDTQTIFSIADDKNKSSQIEEYKTNIFKDNANMICIGYGSEEKALLKAYDNSQDKLITNTFEIIENV